MNINELKQYGKLTEDNREKAAEHWARTWGFDFWFTLWAYRTYEYGRFKYKSGKVTMRHYSYNHIECFIDGNAVTESQFKKELAKEPLPPYEPSNATKNVKTKRTPNATQLRLKLD